MKKFSRISRRRLEAALRIRIEGRDFDVEPVIDDPHDCLPAEVIDLATGPFELRFPDLAVKRKTGR